MGRVLAAERGAARGNDDRKRQTDKTNWWEREGSNARDLVDSRVWKGAHG